MVEKGLGRPINKFLWTASILLGASLTIYVGHEIEDDMPWYLSLATLFFLGLGVFQLQKSFEPKRLIDWTDYEKADREAVVVAGRWTGEVKANRETIRAALLTGEGTDYSTVVIHRPDRRVLQAEREKKGWRIEGARPGEFSDSAVFRNSAALGPVKPPPIWNLLADEPGDFFKLAEAEEILLAFAQRGTPPADMVMRRIERKK